MIALPLRLIGCNIMDADDNWIALIRGLMPEYREWGAEIVAAVNSRDRILDDRDKLRQTRADLLAAEKEALDVLEGVRGTAALRQNLRAAIAKMEQAR